MKPKYQIGERVLLKNNRIETIMSIIIAPRVPSMDIDIKYHFERMWCAFRWEDQIVCSAENFMTQNAKQPSHILEEALQDKK